MSETTFGKYRSRDTVTAIQIPAADDPTGWGRFIAFGILTGIGYQVHDIDGVVDGVEVKRFRKGVELVPIGHWLVHARIDALVEVLTDEAFQLMYEQTDWPRESFPPDTLVKGFGRVIGSGGGVTTNADEA